MKKIKLITSLSSLGVLVTATPIVATSCSKNLNSNLSTDYDSTIEGFELPSKMHAGNSYVATVTAVRSNTGAIVPTWLKVEWTTSSYVDVIITGNTVIVTPTLAAAYKDATVVIGAYSSNGDKIAEASQYIESITFCKNTMVFKGVEYELADNLNPNIFVSNGLYPLDLHSEIPLKEGGYIEIQTDGWGRSDWVNLTALKLTSVDKSVTKIQDKFLSSGFYLTTLDLSGLTTITKICNDFLYNCKRLVMLKLPNENPELISFRLDEYSGCMEWLPNSTIINCGQYLPLYRKISPWSRRSNQMTGLFGYSIDTFSWYEAKKTVNTTTEFNLTLLEDGKEVTRPMPLTWKIIEADECLNATIDRYTYKLYITPTSEAINKSCILKVGAYLGEECLATTTFAIPDVFHSHNK